MHTLTHMHMYIEYAFILVRALCYCFCCLLSAFFVPYALFCNSCVFQQLRFCCCCRVGSIYWISLFTTIMHFAFFWGCYTFLYFFNWSIGSSSGPDENMRASFLSFSRHQMRIFQRLPTVLFIFFICLRQIFTEF